jgi:hypothetical protein
MSELDDNSNSGREAIRRHLFGWSRQVGGIATVARNTGLGISAIDDFATGRALTMSPEALDLLARTYLNGQYLADRDKLAPINPQPSIPLPEPRPQFVPTTEAGKKIVALHKELKAAREAAEPKRPPPPAVPKGKPAPRPGWVE